MLNIRIFELAFIAESYWVGGFFVCFFFQVCGFVFVFF